MAKLLDMSESGVRCLEEGYNMPKAETIMRLSEIFNVSVGYLAMLSDDPKVEEDPSVKEVYLLAKLHNATLDDVVGTVYINRESMHGKDYTAFLAPDDSMTKARIFKGDELIVSRQNYASSNDIVVALLPSGEEVVRRYQRVGNMVMLIPESDNPKHRIIKIDVVETPLALIGKVQEVRISMK